MVSEEARGLWADILSELAPELAPAIEARGNHVPCPVHGGKDGFRVFEDFPATGGGVCNTCGKFAGGITLLAWARQITFKEAARLIGGWLEGERCSPRERRRDFSSFQEPDPSKARASIKKIWAGCIPIDGTFAERYLQNRGIPSAAHSRRLRFHPGLTYFEKVDGKVRRVGTYPAMVAAIQLPDDRGVCLHRTYLSAQGGKAQVTSPKKMTMRSAPARGAAIRLFQATEVLAVAEGIETSLAVRAATGLPVWAAISATLMETLEIPVGVRVVHIFADKDENGRGLQAAERLAERMRRAGCEAKIHLPTGATPPGAKGIDWLDVWVASRGSMFPRDLTPLKIAA